MEDHRSIEMARMTSFRTIDRVRQQLFGEAVLVNDGDISRADTPRESKDNHGTKEIITQEIRPDRPAMAFSASSRLLKVPTELQIMILGYLTFGQIESLRRTCRFLRREISKPIIRELFPRLKFELLSTCYRCLCYEPLRAHLVRADESDARYPLANECLDCVAARGGFMVGRKYTLGTWASVWACRYCGYPITSDAAWNEPEFHRLCYRRFHKIMFYYFLVGSAQSVVAIVGAALCWSFFRKEKLVLAPTIVNFFMGAWVFCLTMVRSVQLRTYHWALILELGILVLWIPPMYAIIREARHEPARPSKADIATLFFVACNIMFRLLNVLGNTILVSEYKLWRRYRPGRSLARRALYQIIAFLVFWTYPQSVEQRYPGKWWFTKTELPCQL
ncbi:hypothetical protein FZEAL_5923 [Fusarium zealandicum]|uniref:F-box domain-containing protein n=1 Tax=Fusarium zealandicum TaxID=1053134 RepID=A0A8H4UIR2_9HYPO|nr:hypothetical protein FZEAL_5923 [Fusarium zealandicum]